ncbi:MAG TPA: type II toxin-antitoxin system VapC family toxin, partial [Geminicoccaceae bacterium]|nr:type II toxin-antitoxin system VapC family toxin [Geminicoccaceae bacterium]
MAVKWYLDEPHAGAARRLLGGSFRPLAPGFLFAEVGNVLGQRWRRGELTREDVDTTLAALDPA